MTQEELENVAQIIQTKINKRNENDDYENTI